MIRRALIPWLIAIGLCAMPATAQDAPVTDPAIEREARELGQTLRCVVCQSESIEASNAELAADMRALVREQLAAGQTPDEVRAYLRARYGDYVLLRPPVQRNTLALWFAPLVLLLGMAVWLWRRRRSPSPAPTETALTDEERAALRALRDRTAP